MLMTLWFLAFSGGWKYLQMHKYQPCRIPMNVCFSHLSLGQLSPIAVREASVMLLQPDTQRICSLWHPRHRLTRPSSVICWRRQTHVTDHKTPTEAHGHIPYALLSLLSAPTHFTSKLLSYRARLHINGGELRAMLLKVFQCSVVQLGRNETANLIVSQTFNHLCLWLSRCVDVWAKSLPQTPTYLYQSQPFKKYCHLAVNIFWKN